MRLKGAERLVDVDLFGTQEIDHFLHEVLRRPSFVARLKFVPCRNGIVSRHRTRLVDKAVHHEPAVDLIAKKEVSRREVLKHLPNNPL